MLPAGTANGGDLIDEIAEGVPLRMTRCLIDQNDINAVNSYSNYLAVTSLDETTSI